MPRVTSAPSSDQFHRWNATEGRAFITGSSEAWGQAAVEAGTDLEVATAAAGRTTAFYTGESA